MIEASSDEILKKGNGGRLVEYYDEDGNKIGVGIVDKNTSPESMVGKSISPTSDGKLWVPTQEDKNLTSSVTLNKDTGKITINAPSLAIKNETFKKNLTDTMKVLSANYKSNPDYKYNIVNENGENEEKSVDDIIAELNSGVDNKNSIAYMAKAAIAIENEKEAHRNANGVELSDEDVMRVNTLAIGPEIKDDTLQLISNLPEANFLRNVESYDEETGFAEYKDIMDNAWNKEKTSSEDMIRLIAALENYFKEGNYDDTDEYVRNVATMRFIDATQPNMSWIRDVVENVRGAVDGVLGYATELGTGAVAAGDMVGKAILGLDDDYFELYGEDYSNLYVARGGSQFANDMPMEKVDAKIGRVRFDANGVPTYKEEKITGSFDNPQTYGESLRAIFKENQAVIKKDMEYLHESQVAWDSVAYAITNLAALISAGNWLSGVISSGAGALAAKYAASSAAKVAKTIYSTGTALNIASTAEGANAVVNGMKIIYDVAAGTGKAAQFLNTIQKAVSTSKATSLLLGVVGESLAEAVVGDNNRFIEVLNNKEIDDDTKDYLIGTYVGNAMGWGVGMGVGKYLMKASKSAKGQAISYNWSRKIFKVQNAVGDAFDRTILTIRRVKGDTLADQIQELLGRGSKYANKQANALAANKLLRDARQAIIDSDAITIAGKSTDEIEEALSEARSKIVELENLENSLNSMQRQGQDIAARWLKDEGAGLKEAASNFYSKAGKLADLEKGAGDMFKSARGMVSDVTSGKQIRLFSQTTTNYIKATEKLDYINAYLNKFENAKDVTDDVLRKIEAYKEEIPELTDMIKKFTDNASSELKLAADNFIDADRKWWAAFEDLRSDLGLTSKVELEDMRASGLWGDDGGLYARTSRRTDLSEYTIKHRNGEANVRTYDSYEQYMAGSSGDFADPMGEMQIALYDAANKQAYRDFAKSYDALTGSMTMKVSGEQAALVERMKKGLQNSYINSSKKFLDGLAQEATLNNGGMADVISKLKLKVEQKVAMNKNKKAMNTLAEKLQKKLGEVNSENASMYIRTLDAEDTTALWDEFYDVTIRELIQDGGEYFPEQTKRYILKQARDLGINLPKNPKPIDAYDAVNRALSGTADSVDLTFENKVKRSVLSRNKYILEDARVQKVLTAQRQAEYEAKLTTFLAERTEEYNKLSEEYGVTVEALNAASRDTLEGYVAKMIEEGSGSRAAIDELCRFYGLEGDSTAIRYFALSSFMDNEKYYKKELFNKIKEIVENEHPEFNKVQRNKVTGVLTNGVANGMKEEFNDARLILKEINPDAVHDTNEKIMSEVNKLAKEIEDIKSNQYSGSKNIIAMRNTAGQVEYYETDPLLAGLMNFTYSQQKMNGLTQAIYNTNYLWAKLFRLGTTAINIKSIINQSFRDPINMFLGGGAYRTTQRCIANMKDVAGEDVVEYIRKFEPEAFRRLERTAAETGENIQELAIKREIILGKAISPAATETNMYKSLRSARDARMNGAEDIYDVTVMDRLVNGIDNVGNKLGRLNEIRETTLRNLSYANALDDALSSGYSLAQARTHAAFVMNEATTNFTRMTGHLTSLRDTVPYLGAAINGHKSFFKLLSMDPVGVVGRLVGGIIIPTMALTANSLSNEENRKVYQNIKEYEKQDSLVFVVNGQAFSIQLPQEISSFIAPFRQVVEGMHGAANNTFSEFLWNDILGFSPIELRGFADLDFAKIENSSQGFTDRLVEGISKMWAQLAPAPLKSGLELVTGVDPYTGRKIDTSYLDYDEDGNPIIKDYRSGKLAQSMNDMFKSWGLSSSAPVVQNILSNIFGQASVDIADFLVSLAEAVPNGMKPNWTFDTEALEKNEGYNPLYTLRERVTAPIKVGVYDEAQSAWRTAVAKLYNKKKEILTSDAWSEYLKAKANANDPEKLKNINSSKKDMVEDYFNTVKNIVTNLQKNYGEEFTAAKYATVLSLMTMEEQTLDAGSYGNYLNKEEFKTARAQAIQTMIRLGFESSSDQDILGKFSTDRDGNIKVRVNPPLAILQIDDQYGASIGTQSNKQHFATIRGLITDSDVYGLREKYYNDVDVAYDAKNYKEVERIMNEYNEKVIKVIAPYIIQYTPESVLQSDVMDYLEDFIMVPSSFMGKGKYYSSKTGLNKQQGYARNYIKAIFGYGENKINGN